MNLRYKKYELKLAHPFRIARGAETVSSIIILGIHDGTHLGWGEACPGSYYGDSLEKVEAAMRREIDSSLPERGKLIEFFGDLRLKYSDSPSARAAFEMALYDLYSQATYEPLYKFLNLPSRPPVISSFTIGIDEPEIIEQKIAEAADFPLLKIKLGGGNDEEIIKTIRKHTDKPLRVDANCG